MANISVQILTVTFLLITESSLCMYKAEDNPRIVQFPLHTVYTLLELDATDKHNVLLIEDADSVMDKRAFNEEVHIDGDETGIPVKLSKYTLQTLGGPSIELSPAARGQGSEMRLESDIQIPLESVVPCTCS